jgi:DNA-binding beta-propeller fold protein YncE
VSTLSAGLSASHGDGTHGESTGAGAMPGFEPVPLWAKLPHGRGFGGDATSVAVDSQDRVFVFNRGEYPVVVFDIDGNMVDAWGVGEFDNAHGLAIDASDHLFLVDNTGHFVQKRTTSGELLLQLGTRGKPVERHSAGFFNRPTDAAIHPLTGDIFVTDGYENSRVHRFTSEGQHILSWGEPGGGPGQFYLPHGVTVLDDGYVAVCDRENFRVQIFTVDGHFVDQWHRFRPLAIRSSPVDDLLYVAELGPSRSHHGLPQMGNRIAVLSRDGTEIGGVGAPTPGPGLDQFMAPHGIAFDSRGDMYVAEVAHAWAVGHLGLPAERGAEVSFKKWSRMSAGRSNRDGRPADSSPTTVDETRRITGARS